MPFLQVELALNKVLPSHAHLYLCNNLTPSVNSRRGIIKTYHAQNFFFFFVVMERIRKGSDLPKNKWGSPCIQQKYSRTKLTQRPSALHFVECFAQCVRLMYDIACAYLMNSVCSINAQ